MAPQAPATAVRAAGPDAHTVDAIVIGGGVAGLTAARALHAAARRFALIEAESQLGGVVRTERRDGFLLEGGPDSILVQKPEALELCRELGLAERVVPTNPEKRSVFVLRHGRLFPLPDGMVLGVPTRFLPLATTRLFSWPAKLRMGLDLLIPARRDDGDESIASFVKRRLGREALELVGEPLMAGIHAGDPEKLSIRATFPRFADLEKSQRSVILGLLAQRRKLASGAGGPGFVSLLGGMRELVDALVAALPSASLHRGERVAALTRSTAGFEARSEAGTLWRAPRVVMAAPAHQSHALLGALSPELAAELRAIPFVSTATVLLGFRRDQVRHPLDGYGLVVPRTENLCTSACSFVTTKLPGRAPEGRVLLRAFMGGARDPDVLSLEDRSLVYTAMRELRDPLGISGEPVVERVFRWPRGTPQLEVGHLERMQRVEDLVGAVPGLFVTGAGLRGTGIPDMVADGSRAGRAAASATSP